MSNQMANSLRNKVKKPKNQLLYLKLSKNSMHRNEEWGHRQFRSYQEAKGRSANGNNTYHHQC